MSGAGAHKRGQQLAIRCAKLRREGLSLSEVAPGHRHQEGAGQRQERPG